MGDEEFEWDDRKAEENFRKHKINFQNAKRVFEDDFVNLCADSSVHGEDRFLATGMVSGRLVTVVYTERGERIRIISARKASSDEQRDYHRGTAPP